MSGFSSGNYGAAHLQTLPSILSRDTRLLWVPSLPESCGQTLLCVEGGAGPSCSAFLCREGRMLTALTSSINLC